MNLLICIDDTDNLESRGTGSIAAEMTDIIKRSGWGGCGLISRHQLVLHEDVRYTSHNSSMCFGASIDEKYFTDLRIELSRYLAAESAEGSDPGMCIADIKKLDADIPLQHRIIEFGYRAKVEVLTKDAAYALADEAGIFLNEFGGNGEGVIGALAGIGLRLHGNDGEVKGGIGCFEQGRRFTVNSLLTHELISDVCTLEMDSLARHEEVFISWKAKPVLHEGFPVLLVRQKPEHDFWSTLVKNEMRNFGEERAIKPACEKFRFDVPEEHVGDGAENCYNCVYRRWTADSFSCMLGRHED
ncbi:MAG: hypothetical protein PQJ61_01690 [Spirochaetales bacterium]|uniref:tRNA(Ile2) 2-agmatinylcytidine synthetase n=1 Tax=Candidatus Thalassospirochaeta sargassi TaxID=3119039 RepID=A0AAJ1IA34_9SPIO|nr:hypothetical protein [Spirochaetales bacterium]